MKKQTLLWCTVFCLMVGAVTLGIASQVNVNRADSLLFANIEALSGSESGNNNISCYVAIEPSEGHKVVYCGDCLGYENYSPNGKSSTCPR